jgi:hypothetical protein
MQPSNNVLVAFLQELLQRFATKSPKFFRIWQLVLSIVTAVTGLPETLQMLGITLPPSLCFFENKIVAACTAGAFFMSLLTTQSKPVAIMENGELLKKTNEKQLPFTAEMEHRAAVKNNGITPVKPTE